MNKEREKTKKKGRQCGMLTITPLVIVLYTVILLLVFVIDSFIWRFKS